MLAVFAVLTVLAIPAVCFPEVSAGDEASKSIADLGSKHHEKVRLAKEELLVEGKAAIPQLIVALDDPDQEKKRAIIQVLGQLKASDAVPRLIQGLKREGLPIRRSIAFTLGLIGDERAFPHLITLVGPNEESSIRGTALIALGYLHKAEAIPVARGVLSDPDQQLRIAAATCLGMLGNREGLTEALEGTKSKNLSILSASIGALGAVGDTRALPRLEEVLTDTTIPFKSDALHAKVRIEYANADPTRRLDILRRSLYEPSTQSVQWAINTLAGLGSDEALSLIQAKAQSGDSRESQMAKLKLRILGR